MSLLFLLQTPTPTPVVVSVPERMPALFTMIYLGGFLFLVLILLFSLFRNRRRSSAPTATLPEDLPQAVRRRLGSTSTNRGLARSAMDFRFARGRDVWFSYLLGPLRRGVECKVSGTQLQRPAEPAPLGIYASWLAFRSERQTGQGACLLSSRRQRQHRS